MLKKLLALILTLLVMQGAITQAVPVQKKDKSMTRTEICNENMQKLFGSGMATSGDDVEMMQILQKYIFGEVFTVGDLDIKTRELITVVCLTTMQTLPQLKAHINGALNAGNSPLEVREAIYQCAPFIGFPKTLNALGVLNEVFKERNIQTPLESAITVSENERYQKGREIQEKLYGDAIKQAMKGLPQNMGDEAARFLTEVCFGDFYTRKGLDIKTRELLSLAILVTKDDDITLKSHIKGSIKAGNSPETVAAAIIQCMPYTGTPNALHALKYLKEELKK